MSVIPLSVAEEQGLIGIRSTSDDGPTPADHATETRQVESEKFDKHFERSYSGAIAELERGQETPKRTHRNLDDALDDAIEPFSRDLEAGKPLRTVRSNDALEFDASKEERAELEHRYAAAGDFGETLWRFLHMGHMLRANPSMAGQEIAASYMRASPWGMTERKPEEYGAIDWKYATPLDKAIRDSMSAAKDKKDFEATAQQREELRRLFPTMTFDQALGEVVRIDTLLRKDPLGGAGQLAAAFGMPVTPAQERAAQLDETVTQAIAHADQHIPALRHPAVRATAARHVLMSPYFVSSDNPVHDLARATQQAQKILQNGHQEHFELVNSQEFNRYRSGDLNRDLAVAGEMLRRQHAATQAAVPGQIAAFARKHPDLPVYRTDMAVLLASGEATDLPTAYARAKHERQQRSESVRRAKRALPVRGSASIGSQRGDNSLDSIIGGALDRAGI
jgi:hypothetical protein